MQPQGISRPEGHVALRVVRPGDSPYPARELSTLEIVEHAMPKRGLPPEINDWRSENSPNILRALRHQGRARRAARRHGLPYFWSQLWLTKVTPDGLRIPYGLASMRVVTDVGVQFIVDAFQNLVELENMKYHGIGTDNTAEAASDTALIAELTTQYSTDNTRATGTTVEGAAANVYRTVGTNQVDAAVGIVEHGVLDQAATGGGVLLDRSVFAVINLAIGDSLESTYDLTINSGG